MLKGLDTSTIKYYTALSPTSITVAGSTNAIDLSNSTFATLIVDTGSTAAATITADMVRSSASNGTFHNFGASVSAAVLGGKHVRSFATNSSDVWYKVYYTQTGSGSPVMNFTVAGQGQREAPIDQDTTGVTVTSYSVINSA